MPPVTGKLHQFSMLLYKGCLMRKRHYVITFLEIVLPLVAACIPPIMEATGHSARSNSDDIVRTTTDNTSWGKSTPIPPFDPLKMPTRLPAVIKFVYTPQSDLAKGLVEGAMAAFQGGTLNRKFSAHAFDEEWELLDFGQLELRNNRTAAIIGTVFDNMQGGAALPAALHYKIRYGDSGVSTQFFTKEKYRYNGPQISNQYTDTLFLRWQAAVEETFISQKLKEKGKALDYKVWMQKFPYPENDSHFDSISYGLISILIGYGYFVFMLNLVRTVVEEKANGTKELLHMMGMRDSVYWFSTFFNYFMVGVVTLFAVSIIYKVPMVAGHGFFKNTDLYLLLLLLLQFMANLILFCLAISVFFNKGVFAMAFAVLVYCVSMELLRENFFTYGAEPKFFALTLSEKFAICLLPSGTLLVAVAFLVASELAGDGAQWGNMTEFSVCDDASLLMAFAASAIATCIYGLIIWYFDKVWPWKVGVPDPFYFPFTKQYWGLLKPDESVSADTEASEFIEADNPRETPGVVIKHLSKTFRTGVHTKLAVNDISLNISSGKLTVLLGHNGAGKTTIINILTGLYPPSEGAALIQGADIVQDTAVARTNLGVCPQHNVLFDTLTVEEHLRIYAAMKGVCWDELERETANTLGMLRMAQQREVLARDLSLGLKRKLSLAIAFVGGSTVLFLDEPTAGLDVECRRLVWDTLLSWRQDKTIVLATQHMEEAEVLGDRIAVLEEGEIQCCGSPTFLKRKFGSGYHVHVEKNDDFDLEGTTNLLVSHVPCSNLEKESELGVSFKIASDAWDDFGGMFEELEERQEELGIRSFGINVTTMEDVFLSVACSPDLRHKNQPAAQNPRNNDAEPQEIPGSSAQLLPKPRAANQVLCLLAKRFRHAKRDPGILVYQFVLPFVLLLLMFLLMTGIESHRQRRYHPLKMDLAEVYGETDGFVTLKSDEAQDLSRIYNIVLERSRVLVTETQDPAAFVLAQNMSVYNKRLLVGGAFDKSTGGGTTLNLTAWYNGEPNHAAPMSLLLMHSAVLQFIDGAQVGSGITLTNAPLPGRPAYTHVHEVSMKNQQSILAGIFFPFALGLLAASFTLLPIQERESRCKLLQLMTGLPCPLYWMTSFFWDALVHLVASLFLLVPFGCFAGLVFFGRHLPDAIGTAFLLMQLYGWASIPFSYLVSLGCKNPASGFSVVLAITTLMGVASGTIMFHVHQAVDVNVQAMRAVFWVLRAFPPFCVSSGFARLFGIAFDNAQCLRVPHVVLQEKCRTQPQPYSMHYSCCPALCGSHCIVERRYLSWATDSCAMDATALAVDGAFYLILLLLLETRAAATCGRCWRRLGGMFRRRAGVQIRRDRFGDDSGVVREEERLLELSSAPAGALDDDPLRVHGLTKVYRNFYAVDHLTFGVRRNECFGLLGVNGAGKTTTFRMLTGDGDPTEGDAVFRDVRLTGDLKKFQSNLGYCPQSDGLLDRLTGREMLDLLGSLRGLKGRELVQAVERIVKDTDLTNVADKQTRFYSGGNKRKLSLALALIGAPPLLLLDEPTSGVDAASRRTIWNVISQARRDTGAAVVLNTHNLEEAQALCDRLAIMTNGRFCCLGSVDQLKERFGQGRTLVVKLNAEAIGNEELSDKVRKHIEEKLPGAMLKSEYQGTIQYHLVDAAVALSRLFRLMAEAKELFDLDDFLLSDTSLEKIFLTFAKAQRQSVSGSRTSLIVHHF